jgi:AmmeMemoRadiSam system protein B
MKIRKPAVAGQFYPNDFEILKSKIKFFIKSKNKISDDKKIRAIIVPHAGYDYSGETAGKVFALLKNFSYEKIVILAPSHTTPFYGIAATEYSHYETPLGNLEVDLTVLDSLVNSKGDFIKTINKAHTFEHSLEVELPFIQYLFPNTSIVPLICGHIESYSETAHILNTLWNPETLWVISSDFTHYGRVFDYIPFTENINNELKKLDYEALDIIKSKNFQGFQEYLERTGATICGAEPIKLLLKIIQQHSDNENLQAEIIHYTNSAELTGDFSYSVSYAGIVFK